MLDVLLLDIFFESILPLLYVLISLCRSTGKFRASFSIFLYALFGLFFVLFPITGDPAQEILDELFTSFELSHGYSMYLSFAPLITYSNPEAQKLQIIKENKGKSGVYRWTNLETNKSYVGSSVNLGRRFSTYYSNKYITKNNNTISRALLKYGHSRFRLDILEYCEKSDVLAREQHYLDLFLPEYNILKTAGSLLGFKHSVSTRKMLSNLYTGRSISEQIKAKMSESQRGRTHSAEALAKMSLAKLGRIRTEEHKNKLSVAAIGKTRSEETKLKISKAKGQAVVVNDTETGETTNYSSVREVSRKFSVSNNTIARYIESGLLFKDRYKISKRLV